MGKTKIIGEYLTVQASDDKDPALYDCQESGLNRNKLSHYTSAEVLKKIISDKVLKFSRIDKVNDLLESELFGNIETSHLVYISCFSHDEFESVPMWKIYGKKDQSIRLTLELVERDFSKNLIESQGNVINPTDKEIYCFEKKGNPKADWYLTYSVKDILYKSEDMEKNPIRYYYKKSPDITREMYNLTPMGSIKREEWSYEKETRLIAYLRNTVRANETDNKRKDGLPIPDIDYLLVPIKFDKLKSITVTFSPWMNASTKTDIKLFMEKMSRTELAGVEIKCKNSILTGETNFN